MTTASPTSESRVPAGSGVRSFLPSGGPGIAEWLVYFGALAWIWPSRVVMRGDDFGYYESVAETIRRGARVASDWLEPFNEMLPRISWLVWHVAGNFYAATLGVMAVLAVANFFLLWRWLRPLLPAGWVGNGTIVAVALSPVLLNKTVEFTGVSLGLTCFLGALLAWRAQRWMWFFLCVLVGFLNRQSAVCWLVLPMAEMWLSWRRSAVFPWRLGMGTMACFAGVGAALLAIPPTFARTLSEQGTRPELGHFALQVFTGMIWLGGIAAGWSLLRGEPVPSGPRFLVAWKGRVAWLAAGGLVFFLPGEGLRYETPGLERFAPLALLIVIGLAATVPDALARLNRPALAVAGVFVALVAWRGIWWDYYLCEPALLLACAGITTPAAPRRLVSLGLAAAAFGGTLLWLPLFHGHLVTVEQRSIAYEQALRHGQIGPAQASQAPFGFLGWKLFPASRNETARDNRQLADFLKYVDATASIVVGDRVGAKAPAPATQSLHPSGECWPLPADFRPRPLPLNNAEWQAWIRGAP